MIGRSSFLFQCPERFNPPTKTDNAIRCVPTFCDAPLVGALADVGIAVQRWCGSGVPEGRWIIGLVAQTMVAIRACPPGSILRIFRCNGQGAIARFLLLCDFC